LGRIRSDGKLTAGSVFFEGCLDYSDGHIVNLDLSVLDEYSVFPGQVSLIKLQESVQSSCVSWKVEVDT